MSTQKPISSFFIKNEEANIDENKKTDYYVYTDGACINNGKENAIAGFGIYFGENDIRNVSKRVEGKQSNNTAELTAIIESFTIIQPDIESGKKIVIMSDSEYAIKCCTSYGKKIKETIQKKEIPNKELVIKAYDLFKNLQNIEFQHIKAHTGLDDIHSIGNDGADKMANLAIGCTSCPYEKIFLNVPFSKKNEVKEMGAKWEPSIKKWYILSTCHNKDILLERFS